jgi:hypothetical protein
LIAAAPPRFRYTEQVARRGKGQDNKTILALAFRCRDRAALLNSNLEPARANDGLVPTLPPENLPDRSAGCPMTAAGT